MLISRFFLLLTSAALMAFVCLSLLILAGVTLRKLTTVGRIIPFLLLASLYTGLRSVGTYFYAFDVTHHPSAQVSALNLAAAVVSCPTIVCGIITVLQVRKEASRKRSG